MNPFIVVSEKNLKDRLTELCYEPTEIKTGTGTFWKCMKTEKHLLIPFPYEGMYPDFILKDIEKIIGKVKPTLQ